MTPAERSCERCHSPLGWDEGDIAGPCTGPAGLCVNCQDSRAAARAELLAEQRAAHVARIRAGRARAAGAGRSLGTNTPIPLSTRLRARELRLEGLTLRAIAERIETEGLVSLRGTRYSAGAVDRMTRGASPEEE